MAVRGLVEELRKIFPEKQFVISTVTATGNKIARGIAKSGDFVTYLPLDFSFIVKSVLKRVNPSVFIIAETEIWPNLIRSLHKRNIPIVTVNGRISDSSFKGYSLIKFLIKNIFRKITLFCVQTERDKERLLRLGVSLERIQVSGNMKFDLREFSKEATDYRKFLCLKPEEKLLVAGSTHTGEEEMMLGVYRDLLEEFPNLRLLLGPRHPERDHYIEKIIFRHDLHPVLVSGLGLCPNPYNAKDVFILNTVGQLLSFYSIAEVVFVGGSLVKKGGHNILEPAFLEKPVLFGPYMSNFRDIAELFIKSGTGIMVRSQEELKNKIAELLRHPDEAARLGKSALALIVRNQGATKRNALFIKDACGKIILGE